MYGPAKRIEDDERGESYHLRVEPKETALVRW